MSLYQPSFKYAPIYRNKLTKAEREPYFSET